MITVSIDPQTFSNMQSELDWSRRELGRLRAQNETLARELAELRSRALHMADTIFDAHVAVEAALRARATWLTAGVACRPDTTTEDAKAAGS